MKLLILDGNSILNRAFYAIPYLTAPDGLHTGGIYGFLVTFLRTIRTEAPEAVAVAFDLPAPTFRHKAYNEYKATRQKMPAELAEQLPVLKEILTAMRVPILEKEGYEADDIIGTVARLCEEAGADCRILTGDRDDLQLASEKTHILLTTTRMGKTETVEFGPKEVTEKYGVLPEALIEVKGLMGDSSDNIPGVRGVGEKTALSLIQRYSTLEGVYQNLADQKGALLTKLTEGRELAFLSRELGRICREVPLAEDMDAFATKPYDTEALGALFRRLDFKALLEELSLPKEAAAEAVCVTALPYAGELENEKKIYFCRDGETVFATAGDAVYTLPKAAADALFAREDVEKSGHNLKETMVQLLWQGIRFRGAAFDTEIAAYLLDPAASRYALDDICETYLGKRPADCAAAASLLPHLETVLRAEMDSREQTELYFSLEKPTVWALAKMEHAGILADGEQLSALSDVLSQSLSGLETAIYAGAGETFNIQSPKQLGVVLFETLGLPAAKKTKTGYSTDAGTLEKLRGKHPIIDDILEYRQLAKLKSTYAEGLLPMIHAKTGRIHSTFHQTVTATGRLSSSDPNLQNIPVKTELGREIRKVFTAKEGFVLVDADYSQIELRVLAHMSGDSRMQAAFLENADIHTKTAAEIFGVAEYMVTPQMRSRAKTINFGIIYGMGDFSLAGDLKTSRKEAKAYIDSYFGTYSGVRDFMESAKEFARKNGFAKTMLGRRRYIPEIEASNFNIRAFGERVAMNAPIQGSAADIIKLAMLRVDAALEREVPEARLVLQVHDELLVEAPIDAAEAVAALMKREMEGAVEMAVPLLVEAGIGRRWYDAK
ncbi:MAG: DNA polymerase I [Ruminococcaceae bacterium]|nr:DNA polymerase I [Oscillospiraceae bacterium]